MRTALLSLLALCAFPLWASNVCTPYSQAAFSTYPAVVNGVDNLDWGIVRLNWTTDATSGSPATIHRIRYATAAEWAASPGTYTHTVGVYDQTLTDSTMIMNGIVSNLTDGTTYYWIGESQQGGSWCTQGGTPSTQTFTTAAWPGFIEPAYPTTIFNPGEQFKDPAGTTWNYGATGCITFQACLNSALPGDEIVISHGTLITSAFTAGGQWQTPNNPLATVHPSMTIGAPGVFTFAGHGFVNGDQIRFEGDFGLPNPITWATTYTVASATTNTFQVTLNGVAQSLNAIGCQSTSGSGGCGTVYVMKWPLSAAQQKPIIVRTDGILSPFGVRIDPSYDSQMAELRLANDNVNQILSYGAFSGFYTWKGIKWSTGTITNNQTDPPTYSQLLATGYKAFNVIYDRNWIHPAPAPDRVKILVQLDGTNVAMQSSYLEADFWQPSRFIASATVTSNSLTWHPIVGGTGTNEYDFPKVGDVKGGCTLPNPFSVTANNVNATTYPFYVYIDPATCIGHVDIANTAAVSTVGLTAFTVATPAYPVDTTGFCNQAGGRSACRTTLQIGQGTITSGVISWAGDTSTQSVDQLEGTLGVHLSGGPGPITFSNNSLVCGGGVCGFFASDDLAGGSTCGGSGYCQSPFSLTNAYVVRNRIQHDATRLTNSATFDGGYRSPRNGIEGKQVGYSYFDGNTLGPFFSGVAAGNGAAVVFEYNNGQNYHFLAQYNSTNDRITNNLIVNSNGCGLATATDRASTPIRNILFANNVCYSNNGFQSEAWPKTFNDTPQYYVTSGNLLQINSSEAVTVKHNTFYLIGGASGGTGGFYHGVFTGGTGYGPFFPFLLGTLSGGLSITDNLLELTTDGGSNGYATNDNEGSISTSPTANGHSLATLFSTDLVHSRFLNNVINPTYSVSDPLALVELTSPQITALQALYPAGNLWAPGSTVAARRSALGFLDPANQNMRLLPTSAYVSGGPTPASDGKNVGANIEELDIHRGVVKQVHAINATSTSVTITFVAPDPYVVPSDSTSGGCTVDWTTASDFTNWSNITRVSNSGGARSQAVALSSLPAHALVRYRVNCAAYQPQGTVQLP